MSKRTRNVVSYEEAVADIIEWVDNEGDVREIDELIERRGCRNCEKGSSKAEKSNLPKTKEHCESCRISVCRDHSIRMCNDCVNKI